MAAVALKRMSGVVQAKLPPGLGVQGPGGLARPLVLAFLLASATMSSGKGGAGAGRRRGPGRGPGDRPGRFPVSGAEGAVQMGQGSLRARGGRAGCPKASKEAGCLRGLIIEAERCRTQETGSGVRMGGEGGGRRCLEP